jgi:hypothetical protein
MRVVDSPRARRRGDEHNFVVVLRGPFDPKLPQGTYPTDSRSLGSFELFLVPGRPDPLGHALHRHVQPDGLSRRAARVTVDEPPRRRVQRRGSSASRADQANGAQHAWSSCGLLERCGRTGWSRRMRLDAIVFVVARWGRTLAMDEDA